MKNGKPIGIVLLQLGGPDSLESVEPFLYNLFCDPDIIDLPLAFLFRKSLARFISSKRAPKVQEYYKRIGGKSPILKLTMRQARALERALAGKVDCRITIAMRYWNPLTDVAINDMKSAGVERVLLLPLYPHFSKTTTGSSVNEWQRVARQLSVNSIVADAVDEYCEHPLYIKALIRNITIALKRVPPHERAKVNLVFSAHGTPVKLVRAGDPYQQHIIRTYNAVVREGNFGLPTHLCYQSKVGPEKWLEPSLDATIHSLAEQKVSHMIVIPIAFVSDHSETLWEINIEARHAAKELGIRHFDMSPGLNTNPYFIQALADLVEKKVAQWGK
jgi:protoporphyrin/coproporphyrin ferrochelatase